jgi:hypothetical protein
VAEPVNALFATDAAVTVSLTPGGGGGSIDLLGYWDTGEEEQEAGDGYRTTYHRVDAIHFTYAASDGAAAEGDTVSYSGLNHPVLDVCTDGVVTTLALGKGQAP